jgi:hypothetical protein
VTVRETVRDRVHVAICASLLLVPLGASGARAAFNVFDPIFDFVLTVAIDADSTGNGASSVASVEGSASAFVGDTITVDVVIDEVNAFDSQGGCDRGESPGCGLQGFEFELVYDPQILRVVSYDSNQLLCANGCPGRQSQTEPVPDQDGTFSIDEKEGASEPETGEGVLMRIVLLCVAAGTSDLELDHPSTGIPQVFDTTADPYPVSQVLGASVTCGASAIVAPGEEVLVDMSGNGQDSDDTGFRLKNLSQQAGTIAAQVIPGDPRLPGDSVQDGFELIDGTMHVVSDLPAGQIRARYRIEYDVRAVRRAGIRATGVRLMRRDSANKIWVRAVRARAQPRMGRYLPRAEADFVLGHHGFSQSNRYAWAVMDVNSRYAVGGPTSTALPGLAPWALLALGGTLLAATLLESRRLK